MSDSPLLTIAVPTYRRVDLLNRCLASLRPTEPSTMEHLELVVSDNSPDDDVHVYVDAFAADWPGTLRYYRNPEGTGAVGNFNLCIDRARGHYTLILHDDDYLLPGAVDDIVAVLREAAARDHRVVLFGVRVEQLSGRVLRRQTHNRDAVLGPAEAYERLLSDSSYVRVPGLVVATDAYRDVDGFSEEASTTCDVDMSVKLFGTFGVRVVPGVAAAYTVHPGSVTSTVFNPATVERLVDIFARARRFDVLDGTRVTVLQRRWFHQFVLAGTWRALRRRDRVAARSTFGLFSLPEIQALGVSVRWLPARIAFGLLAGAPLALTVGLAPASTDGHAHIDEATREW